MSMGACSWVIAAVPRTGLGRGQGIRLLIEDLKNLALKRPRTLWIVVIGLLAVLVLAWIDGGEEPIRPMEQSVTLPESFQ